jgi:putative transposase
MVAKLVLAGEAMEKPVEVGWPHADSGSSPSAPPSFARSAPLRSSFAIRLRATPLQEALFAQYAGASRWVWNACLAWRSDAYKADGLSVTGVDFSRELTWLKTLGSYAWLNDVPTTVLAQTLRDQDQAFTNFFAKRSRYPRFKRRQTAASIRFQLDSVWS